MNEKIGYHLNVSQCSIQAFSCILHWSDRYIVYRCLVGVPNCVPNKLGSNDCSLPSRMFLQEIITAVTNPPSCEVVPSPSPDRRVGCVARHGGLRCTKTQRVGSELQTASNGSVMKSQVAVKTSLVISPAGITSPCRAGEQFFWPIAKKWFYGSKMFAQKG